VSRTACRPRRKPGEPVELARYTLTACERTLYGQRIDGLVRVTDRPAGGMGRSYLVERGLRCDGNSTLNALVADYTYQAERLDEIPMAARLARRVEEGELARSSIEQVELARYTLTGGERVLFAQRIDGALRLTDRPASGPGRSYLVECGLERDGYSALKALVADYTRQAGRLDEIPMAASLRSLVAAERQQPSAWQLA
jgi:hypothetical protein